MAKTMKTETKKSTQVTPKSPKPPRAHRTPKTLRPQNLKLLLRANSGLALGTIYPLNLNRNVLGRSVDAMVPVDDSKVSRNHASVDIQNGFHYLVDLGSINGTFLNGHKIERAMPISVGDELRIGSSVFHVELLDQAKNHAGKSWREATRAIVMKDHILSPAALVAQGQAPIAKVFDQTGARWSSLLEPKWTERFTVNDFKRKWISAGVCLLLVVAAIVSTFGR